jgi:virginiamycin B lyase
MRCGLRLLSVLAAGMCMSCGVRKPVVKERAPQITALRTSDISEYPIPTPNCGSGGGMAAGPDGNVWFTEQNASRLARIATDGSITEFVTPSPDSGPTGLAFDSSGVLWFTEQRVNKMGRLSPDGTFTEFPLRSGRKIVSPRMGPDGGVWYAGTIVETKAGVIGRFDPKTGDVTEFPTPTSNSEPRSIRNGLDGNLYFTEGNANKIGRITMGGIITEFTIPTPDSQPRQLEIDPDGNIWFTESAGNKIGRMTPGGEFTEYPIPTRNSSPLGVTIDSSGYYVFFTEADSNRLGRIDKSGRIEEVDIPTANSFPQALRAGSDGNIYFVERNANKIGRLNVHPKTR